MPFQRFTGVVMDITDQIQAKNSVESAYEQLRLSKEAVQLEFFDLDLTKGTMEWDVKCRELFGISHPGEVPYEKGFITGLHPEDSERIIKVINNVFIKSVTGGVYDIDYRNIGAEDQQLRWFERKDRHTLIRTTKPYVLLALYWILLNKKKTVDRVTIHQFTSFLSSCFVRTIFSRTLKVIKQ